LIELDLAELTPILEDAEAYNKEVAEENERERRRLEK
jgi:hypothetical protein